ncbi:MAG: hypothetical protein ACHQFW_05025 [Chitinophagales bacterium]
MLSVFVHAQNDSAFFKRTSVDTPSTLNMDALYNRPFLTLGNFPVAIGGYMEANTQYAVTDGVTDGFSFQFRRMSIFLSSTIGKKLKFLSEIEFEDGGREINIEYAAMDIEFHPLLNLKGGIVLNPIGSFNQNHDGPRWDFIDRPISSTTILPATLSNAGFGLHGKLFKGNWVFGYELYLTNGFNDELISNTENRTSLSAGKSDPEKFEESNSGSPMFTGKIGIRNRMIGELGLSYMSGIYNKWMEDGLILDEKRSVNVFAIDFNTSLINQKLNITGEVAKVFVEIPEFYSPSYGTEQFGFFLDVTGTIIQRKIFDWEGSKINLVARFEYADYNEGTFIETGGNISDHVWAIVPGISFRPVGSTCLRFNYRYQEQTDLLGNPPASTGIIQFGFATYF